MAVVDLLLSVRYVEYAVLILLLLYGAYLYFITPDGLPRKLLVVEDVSLAVFFLSALFRGLADDTNCYLVEAHAVLILSAAVLIVAKLWRLAYIRHKGNEIG